MGYGVTTSASDASLAWVLHEAPHHTLIDWKRHGMLFVLCFLCRLADLTGHHDLWRRVIATESQSLIDTTLEKRFPTPAEPDMARSETESSVKSHPLDPMMPKWDILWGIQVLLLSLPLSLYSKFVGIRTGKLFLSATPARSMIECCISTGARTFSALY
jgi:hypothetical protein